MTDPLLAAILSLDGSARSIDATFAAAARQLGETLAMFEATHARLGAVSDELAASHGMDRLQHGIRTVAGDLRAFSGGLSTEAARLHAIAAQGEVASRSFNRLMERIGRVNAVARCARIESARLRTGQEDPGFFGTIGDLVDLARQSVQDCAEGHVRLKALLESAIGTQTRFAATYEIRLTVLADDLERSLAGIAETQTSKTRLAAAAARQSREVADSIGAAIVALQCGDSTRQRLEHAVATLQFARRVAAGENTFDLPEPDRQVLLHVLHSLVTAQLRDIAPALRLEIDGIDTALRLLGQGMAACQHAGPASDGSGSDLTSPLATFEADLACASDLLAKCNVAQEQVDRVTTSLTTFVDQFQQTVRSLSGTVANIVLLGMNARLHAARSGPEGRVLVAIAQELKSVADEIVDDAAHLSPTLGRLHELASSMQTRTAGAPSRLGLLDDTLRGLLATMTQKLGDLGETLEQLTQDSSTYAIKVTDARHAFTAATTAATAIEAAADTIEPPPTGAPCANPTAIERLLKEHVHHLYTMAAERNLHRTTLIAYGLTTADPEPETLSAATPLDAIFAF